jgi:uncharacterized protein (DUF58 family)
MITNELLKKVRQIQIRTKRIVNDVLGGEYRSSFRGRGMEFEEVREYLPGDEIRSIDWNVTARTGTPYIKRYREERELVVMLVVDVSPSSEFGTVNRLKRDIANELCAVLAFSAINNNDKVGMILFSNGIEKFVPPRKGKTHVLRVIRELLYSTEGDSESRTQKPNILGRAWNNIKGFFTSFKPYGKDKRRVKRTDIAQALDYLNRVTKKRSVVFLVSDFMDEGYKDKLRLTNKKHDLVCVVVEDPLEKELPEGIPSLIELEDAETGDIVEVDFGSDRVRKEYRRDIHRKRGKRDNLFTQSSIDSIHIDTGKDYTPELMKFFKMRETRR